jgi:hypothetical protein
VDFAIALFFIGVSEFMDIGGNGAVSVEKERTMKYQIVYKLDYVEVVQEQTFENFEHAEHALDYCMPYMEMQEDVCILSSEE